MTAIIISTPFGTKPYLTPKVKAALAGPTCVCPECGARVTSDFGPLKDVVCPKCGRTFNPIFGDGAIIAVRGVTE